MGLGGHCSVAEPAKKLLKLIMSLLAFLCILFATINSVNAAWPLCSMMPAPDDRRCCWYNHDVDTTNCFNCTYNRDQCNDNGGISSPHPGSGDFCRFVLLDYTYRYTDHDRILYKISYRKRSCTIGERAFCCDRT